MLADEFLCKCVYLYIYLFYVFVYMYVITLTYLSWHFVFLIYWFCLCTYVYLLIYLSVKHWKHCQQLSFDVFIFLQTFLVPPRRQVLMAVALLRWTRFRHHTMRRVVVHAVSGGNKHTNLSLPRNYIKLTSGPRISGLRLLITSWRRP